MAKTNNRSRILNTCRELMNAEGAQGVGTTRLCEALEISPGNLYYHFKNKEEIVRALFDSLQTDFKTAFGPEPSEPIQPAAFAGYYIRTLEVAYQYRFFFSGLLHLLRQDDQLAADYRALQEWALDGLARVAARVARDGHLNVPNSQKRYRSIAINTWLIWSNWVRYLEISRSSRDISRADMILGIEQIFDVLSGYLAPDYEKAVRRHLKQVS
tara:strand:+ start:200 stop:838 length:639 start_codon:yes stop_codon:yes gene_type:complete